MSVAELLQASRDAHQRYRENVSRRVPHGQSTIGIPGDATAAGLALVEACRFRTEAHALDPQHVAAAWRDEPLTHDHDALQDFYAHVLSVQ